MSLTTSFALAQDLHDVEVPVPVGNHIDLGERGTGFVRTMDGPGDTPIVLLHGLTAGSALNWFYAFEPLSQLGPVIAPDLRGHGRGLGAPRRFEMSLNADDVVAILDAMGISQPVIAVGFSMGGAVAQELAHRHPSRVAHLVPVSTAARFAMAPIGKRLYATNAIASRAAKLLPEDLLVRLIARAVSIREPGVARLAVDESARHSPTGLVRAANALSRFKSRPWLGDITVPSTVIVSTKDRSLRPALQRDLAERLGADIVEIPTGHAGIVYEPEIAVPPMVEAIASLL